MSSITSDIKILMNLRRLKDIRRCNNFHTINTEDVAQHSYYVTLLAMVFADEYNQAVDEFNYVSSKSVEMKLRSPQEVPLKMPAGVPVEMVLRKALLHDIDEAYTSDIPWNIKHFTPEFHDAITKVIAERMKKVYDHCSWIFREYSSLSETCKEGISGTIVDLADMVELAIYCYEECQMGNVYLKDLLAKCVNLSYGMLEKFPMLSKIPTVSCMLDLFQDYLGNDTKLSLLETE